MKDIICVDRILFQTLTFLVALCHFTLGFLDHGLNFLFKVLFSVNILGVSGGGRVNDEEGTAATTQIQRKSSCRNSNGHGIAAAIRKLRLNTLRNSILEYEK